MLARTRLGDGRETTRWFPLTVETAEVIMGEGRALNEAGFAEAILFRAASRWPL